MTRPRLELIVSAKHAVADGVVALTLASSEGHRLPDWAPGAHIDVMLPNGLTRQYSLCGDRWDPATYRIGVLEEPASRGGSAYLHHKLQIGDRVGIGGPRNNFRLVPSEDYLFIAGGIGVTPLLPMVHQAELVGARWRLLYCGRSRSTMAFLDDLSRYGDNVVVAPSDERGRLSLGAWLPAAGVATKVYCCGPDRMLATVAGLCARYPAGQLRIERFAAKKNDIRARTERFRLELRRSAQTVEVSPDESVLDALTRVGVNVLSSCRQGVCGTCLTAVLAGEPDHRDSLLDDVERAAGDRMFVCVSRSLSERLVVDL
nr:PDR/VanB family oxidoreductase [Mycobacterium sp. 1465703.0]